MPNESTPGSVLDRLRQNPGDRESLSRLMDFCQGYFLCWARKFLRDPHDQEDFVQELFMRVLKDLETFEYDDSKRYRGRLFLMARNLAVEFMRRAKRNAKTGHDSLIIEDEAMLPDFVEEEFRAYIVQRAQEIMRSDFEETTWRAALMLIIDRAPAAEVAKELGMSLDAVYMAKSRVLKRLREELGNFFD